jgi:hypothetical protein
MPWSDAAVSVHVLVHACVHPAYVEERRMRLS